MKNNIIKIMIIFVSLMFIGWFLVFTGKETKNQRKIYYEKNCKSINSVDQFFNCQEKQAFINKEEELKYLLYYAKQGNSQAQYIVYSEFMNNKYNKSPYNIDEKTAMEYLKKCAAEYNSMCVVALKKYSSP